MTNPTSNAVGLSNSPAVVLFAYSQKQMSDTQAEEAKALRTLFDRHKEETGMSQAEFGKRFNIGNQSMVSQYLLGVRPLNILAASNFASGLGVTVSKFSPRLAKEIIAASRFVGKQDAKEPDSIYGNVRPAPHPRLAVPIVSWVSAGPWDEAIDPWVRGEGMGWVETDVPVTQQRAIALIVEGNSMENPKGEPSFPDGCTIIVDGSLHPRDGDFVVVRAEDWDKASFKQYRIDAGEQLLVPLNPQYSALRVPENTHFVGVVVEMIPARKRFRGG